MAVKKANTTGLELYWLSVVSLKTLRTLPLLQVLRPVLSLLFKVKLDPVSHKLAYLCIWLSMAK